jgi:hypothetical protein
MEPVPSARRARSSLAVLLSTALIAQAFPSWAQVLTGATLSAPDLGEAVPLTVESQVEPVAADRLALEPATEALSSESLPLSEASLPAVLPAGRQGKQGRLAPTALERAAPGTPRKAAAAMVRPATPARSLSGRIWQHAELQGFAVREAPALEVDEASSLQAPRRPVERLSPLLAAPQPSQRIERVRAASPEWQFLSSMAFVDIGVEALAVAVPQLAESVAGHFLSASAVSTVAFAALTVGTLLAGPIIDRLGFRKVYGGLQISRAVGGAVLAGLYFKGAIGLPALTFLFGFDYLLQGVSRVAEGVLPTLLHGSQPAALNRFGTRFEMMIELCGIAIPAATGVVLAAKGFGPVLAAYPVFMLASSAITLLKLRLPRNQGPLAFAGSAIWEKGRMKEVARAFRENPSLRRAAVGYGLGLAISNFIYFSIAPAFGLFVAAQARAGAGIAANFISFYALGGLLGTGILTALDAWAKRKQERSSLPAGRQADDDRRKFLRATAGWLVAGAVSALGAWLLPFAAGAGAWLGYAAVIPFGVTYAGVFVQLETLIKSESPAANRASVLAVVRAAALLFATAGSVALGAMFEAFSTAGAVRVPTPAAFVALGAAAVLASLTFLWAARGLRTLRRW